MVFHDTIVVCNILHLNQSTCPPFMIAHKQAERIITAQVYLHRCHQVGRLVFRICNALLHAIC